jgi:hypothetical protein
LARRALADTYLPAHRLLVASLAQLDDRAATEEALRALLAVAPGYTVSTAIARFAIRDKELLRRCGRPDCRSSSCGLTHSRPII